MAGDINNDLGSVIGQCFREVADVLSEQVTDGSDEANDDSPQSAEAAAFYERSGGQVDEANARNPLELTGMLLVTQLFAVADFLRGIGLIGVHGKHRELPVAFSAAPVARALLESLAQIRWLVEPDIGFEERVRRLIDDMLRDHRSRHRVVVPAQTDGVDVVLDTEGIAEVCDLYGVKYRWGKPDAKTGIRFPVIEGAARPSAFDLLSTSMPSSEYEHLGAVLYHLMSDVAHASTQGLLGRASVSADQNGLSLGFSRIEILKGVAPVLWALDDPVRGLYAYLGWDESRFRDVFGASVTRLSDVIVDYSSKA